MLHGVIDETSNLQSLANAISGPVTLDLFDIQRISSIGVREWINFISSLTQSPTIRLSRCSPQIVAQLNSVYNFRGRAEVLSVVGPYYCGKCDEERFHVIPLPKSGSAKPEALVTTKPNCIAPERAKGACEMEFDDVPDRYFLFLTYPDT